MITDKNSEGVQCIHTYAHNTQTHTRHHLISSFTDVDIKSTSLGY